MHVTEIGFTRNYRRIIILETTAEHCGTQYLTYGDLIYINVYKLKLSNVVGSIYETPEKY